MKVKVLYTILFLSCVGCINNKEQLETLPYIVEEYDKSAIKISIDSIMPARSLVEGFFKVGEDSTTIDDWFDEIALYDKVKSAYLKNDLIITDSSVIPVTEIPPPPLPPTIMTKSSHIEDTIKDVKIVLSNRQTLIDSYYKEDHFVGYQAYPVYVVNQTDTIQSVDFESRMIYMVQQAKDENGHWKEVQYWDHYGTHCCGGPKLDLLPN